MKTILYPIAVMCLFVACHSTGNKQEASVPAADSLLHRASFNPTIPPKKLKYYNAECSAFFDSLLLRRGSFNGSILVAKEGAVVYEKYAGFSNPRTKSDSLKPNSAFHLASVFNDK